MQNRIVLYGCSTSGPKKRQSCHGLCLTGTSTRWVNETIVLKQIAPCSHLFKTKRWWIAIKPMTLG